MATTSVSFSKQGDYYQSDNITATGNALVIQVLYEKSGGTILERSVDGTNFYEVLPALVAYGEKKLDCFETTIVNIVPGQIMRLRFSPDVVPTGINVLQA